MVASFASLRCHKSTTCLRMTTKATRSAPTEFGIGERPFHFSRIILFNSSKMRNWHDFGNRSYSGLPIKCKKLHDWRQTTVLSIERATCTSESSTELDRIGIFESSPRELAESPAGKLSVLPIDWGQSTWKLATAAKRSVCFMTFSRPVSFHFCSMVTPDQASCAWHQMLRCDCRRQAWASEEWLGEGCRTCSKSKHIKTDSSKETTLVSWFNVCVQIITCNDLVKILETQVFSSPYLAMIFP